MITLRKSALCLSVGALLLSGSMSALAAEPTPEEVFNAVWTSGDADDLDDAAYVAVRRSPKDAKAFAELAFNRAPKAMEASIIEAILRALRDLGNMDCDLWAQILDAGEVESDEDDEKYLLADSQKIPNNCAGVRPGPGVVLPGEAANAAPVGGVGSPVTTERVIEVEGPPTGSNPPPSPPFDDDDEGTPTGGGV